MYPFFPRGLLRITDSQTVPWIPPPSGPLQSYLFLKFDPTSAAGGPSFRRRPTTSSFFKTILSLPPPRPSARTARPKRSEAKLRTGGGGAGNKGRERFQAAVPQARVRLQQDARAGCQSKQRVVQRGARSTPRGRDHAGT